jgi:hypothetical protein
VIRAAENAHESSKLICEEIYLLARRAREELGCGSVSVALPDELAQLRLAGRKILLLTTSTLRQERI